MQIWSGPAAVWADGEALWLEGVSGGMVRNQSISGPLDDPDQVIGGDPTVIFRALEIKMAGKIPAIYIFIIERATVSRGLLP